LASQRGPELDPWPAFLSPELIRTQSVFEIQGEPAGRERNAPIELRTWPAPRLLSNSVVQIAVDSAGQVIAARLLARSGSADADTNALDVARRLRFRPAPSPAPVWGRAVFEWQTAEQTNASPAGGP
jgi:TonB family protein